MPQHNVTTCILILFSKQHMLILLFRPYKQTKITTRLSVSTCIPCVFTNLQIHHILI